MFYLAIDQHAMQLTVNLRNEEGTVVLRRQVSTEPERVRVEMIAYPADKMPGLAAPTDAEISTWYDAHVADRFTQQAEVRARHVLVKADRDADAATRDAAIMALASKVKMTAVPGQTEADVAANVTVTLKDGRVLNQRVTEFLGTPARPLTGNDLREKFRLLTQKQPAAQMQRIYDRLQNLEAEANLDWLRV